MTGKYTMIAKSMETMTIGELCALIEASDKNSDVPVMERLVIGAVAAPKLVTFIRERFIHEELRHAR